MPFALSLSKGISLKIKDFDKLSPNGFELICISLIMRNTFRQAARMRVALTDEGSREEN